MSRSSYEVESVEMAEMVILKDGKSWTTKTEDDRQARTDLRHEDRHGCGRGRHGGRRRDCRLVTRTLRARGRAAEEREPDEEERKEEKEARF